MIKIKNGTLELLDLPHGATVYDKATAWTTIDGSHVKIANTTLVTLYSLLRYRYTTTHNMTDVEFDSHMDDMIKKHQAGEYIYE